MKIPNFFIIGAPKCGTTSMAAWLSEHPQVFMTEIKEPHFFNTDHSHREFKTEAAYLAQFAEASEEHLAIGEASVWYLYSNDAVPNILNFNPDAKFVVMIRNPLQMAYSLHDQMLFSQYDNVKSFEEAWNLQETRSTGKRIPRTCVEPQFIQYGKACALGTQLERLYSRVPADKVHVIVFDDLKRDSGAEYRKVIEFLGVADDHRTSFATHNPAKQLRSSALRSTIVALGGLRRRLGISRGFGVLTAMNVANRRERPRPPMSPELHTLLCDYFRSEVQLLEKLLGRDFSPWLE